MKKIFLFLVLIVAITTKAQTFEETKVKTEKQIATLKAEVEKINHELYYLEVELPAKITGDSVLSYSGKKYLLQTNGDGLKKEFRLSKERVAILKSDKKRIEQEIGQLQNILNTAQKTKLSTDFTEDYPETMGVYEYRRRNRALNYRIGEKIAEKSLTTDVSQSEYGVGLPGILFNDKLGQGEIATFTITNKYHPEFGSYGPYSLAPQQRLDINLMPGVYLVRIQCGYYDYTFESKPVDPRNIKNFLGQKCYFFAAKARSDY